MIKVFLFQGIEKLLPFEACEVAKKAKCDETGKKTKKKKDIFVLVQTKIVGFRIHTIRQRQPFRKNQNFQPHQK